MDQLSVQRNFKIALVVSTLAILTASAFAEGEAAETSSRPAYDLWTTSRLTGDWGGLRTELEDKGFTVQLTLQQQYMINMNGGLETSNGSDYAGSYDLNLLFEFEKMFGWKGSEFFIRGKGRWGGEASDFDAEKIGGIAATNGDAGTEEPIYVDKWWWRQRFADNRIEFRLGRVDSGDVVEGSEYAGSSDTQFMNDWLGGQATLPGSVGIGMTAVVWPTDWWYCSAAVVDHETRARRTGFDTGFHDSATYNAYFETGVYPDILTPKGRLPGHYRVGTWFIPGRQNVYMDTLGGRLVQRTKTGDVGVYFGADQMVWRENDDPKDSQGAAVFVKYGYAHGNVNFIEHHWAIGGQYEGLIPGRDNDVFGIGVGQGIVSSDYRSSIDTSADRETVYEMYYNIEVTPWMHFTPDIQYVTQPGGTKDDRNAVVAGFRLRVTF